MDEGEVLPRPAATRMLASERAPGLFLAGDAVVAQDVQIGVNVIVHAGVVCRCGT